MICLPTYNERDNLEPMVRALGTTIDTARDHVLVLDDASPDGTGEIADALAQKLGPVQPTKPEDPGARLSGFANVKMADFIDAFLIGEGEEALPAFLALFRDLQDSDARPPRQHLLRSCAKSSQN